jgi:transposase-like protein
MPKRQNQKQFNQKINCNYSESFKKSIVKQIEKNAITVVEASREYDVTRTSIYNWVYLYSSLYKKWLRQIIEPMSDHHKIKQLRDQIQDLERLLGQKQIEIEFKNKMIELAEELYGIDIKKKFGSKLSDGSGNSGKGKDGV